jgi:hypothetical protein
MIEIHETDLQAVIAASEALLSSLRKLAEGYTPVEDSPEVKEKLGKRECLTCGITVDEGEFYTRGLHKACYNTTMRRIREGRWKEDDRIAEGKLSVGGKPGRPAAIDAAEALAKAMVADIVDNTKPKKVADKKSGYRKDSQ